MAVLAVIAARDVEGRARDQELRRAMQRLREAALQEGRRVDQPP